MYWITIGFCNVCFGILCAILASKKSRSILAWFLLALPLGFIALVLLLALPENPRTKMPPDLKESS